MRGFMTGHVFHERMGHGVVFTVPLGCAWSEAAIIAHAKRRFEAARLSVELAELGFARVGLVDGVAIAMREDDQRPSWALGEEAAVTLFTAQIAWLEFE